MSAYVVSNETINCIVNGLIVHGIIGRYDAVEIGEMLFKENTKSVNYRYNETDAAPIYKFTEKEYKSLEVYGCVCCWQYQTSEYEKHEDAEGWKLTEKLLQCFPTNYKDREYAWGLD